MQIQINPTILNPVTGGNVNLSCSGLGIDSSRIIWRFYPRGSPSLDTIIFKNGAYQNNSNSTYNVNNTDLGGNFISVMTWTSVYESGKSYTYECACAINCAGINPSTGTCSYESISMQLFFCFLNFESLFIADSYFVP